MSVPPYVGGHRKIPERASVKEDEWLSWEAECEPPSPRLRVGSYVRKLGMEFRWSKLHLKSNALNAMREIGDNLVDEIFQQRLLNHKDDLMEQLFHLEPRNNTVRAFMTQVRTVPSWVDWLKVERGQRFFLVHGLPAVMALFNFSLVGGFSAPKINKVLASTGYLNVNHYVTGKRLVETLQMIYDCMKTRESLYVGNKGWDACVRVRFLHAHVRNRLFDSGKWDSKFFGVPINQEDMQGTQLSFCYNVIVGLELLGFKISAQNREDLTHLWRYIGYLMGIEEHLNPCTSFDNAKAVMESIIVHQVFPDDQSRQLAHHSLESGPKFHSAKVIGYNALAQLSRIFMGDVLADILQLPRSTLWLRFWRVMMLVLKFNLSWMPENLAIYLNVKRIESILGAGGPQTDFGFKKVLNQPEARKIERSWSERKAKRRIFSFFANYTLFTVLLILGVIALVVCGLTLGVVFSSPDWLQTLSSFLF